VISNSNARWPTEQLYPRPHSKSQCTCPPYAFTVGSTVGSTTTVFPFAVPVFLLLLPATLSLNGLSEFDTTSVALLCRLSFPLLFPFSRPVLELLLPALLAERGETELETTSTGLEGEVGRGAVKAVRAKRERRRVEMCMLESREDLGGCLSVGECDTEGVFKLTNFFRNWGF